MRRLIARIQRTDRGASLVEYGLLVVAILVASSASGQDALSALLP